MIRPLLPGQNGLVYVVTEDSLHKITLSEVVCLTGNIPYEPHHEKICFLPYANNNGAAQPAHPCSLISNFVVRCLDSIILILSKSKLVIIAE